MAFDDSIKKKKGKLLQKFFIQFTPLIYIELKYLEYEIIIMNQIHFVKRYFNNASKIHLSVIQIKEPVGLFYSNEPA